MRRVRGFVQVFVILLFMTGGVSNGEHSVLPGWDGEEGFTHQSWDFGDDGDYGTGEVTDPEQLPLGDGLPDGEPNYVNSWGSGAVYEFYNSHAFMKGWQYVPNGILTDRRAMYGGMGDTALSFSVPWGSAGTEWDKEVWVQFVVFARKDGELAHRVELGSDEGFSQQAGFDMRWQFIEVLEEEEGNTARWYRVSTLFEVDRAVDDFYVRVRGYCEPDPEGSEIPGATMIDEVNIESRFVHRADYDGSGVVDLIDFGEFACYWGGDDEAGDIDGDGVVDIDDLRVFCGRFLD
jgi:hypothetical protein